MRRRPTVQKSYLAPREVAEMLMVSPATVRNWATNGDLPSISTPGGHRRFMRHELERFARDNNLAINLPGDDSIRLLIVDDDIPVATYLSRFFDQLDVPVKTMAAHDGYTAGRLVHVFQPHIVLLDLMMPGLDGFEVCRKIKSDPTTKVTRVLTMTGYYDESNVTRAIEAGAEHCLAKPIKEGELITLLGLADSIERTRAIW